MTLETLTFYTVAHWYKRQNADTLDASQVSKVETDLNALWRVSSPMLGEISFQNKADIAKHGIPRRFSGVFSCHMDERTVHGISGETYWRYRAISTAITQCILWESFNWKGKKKAWSQMDNILYAIASSTITRQFVRSDLFYKGAVDEHNKCNSVCISNTKLVLSQYGTYQV